MPWGGIRIEEPSRGQWYLKKGRMEEKGSRGLLLCHRGTWLRTVVLKGKRDNGGDRKSWTSVMPWGGVRECYLVADREAKKRKKGERANEG